MGVEIHVDILKSIARGIDMFDCVMSSHNTRNGQLFITNGKLNMRNAKWNTDFSLIDELTPSYASQNFTKGYLAHLVNSDEVLGMTLAAMHNIAFYQQLVRTARKKINEGSFEEWEKHFIERYTKPISIIG